MNRITLVVLAIWTLAISGCSDVQHVSAAEFKREYAMEGQPQSMRTVGYLGTKDGRAFIRIRSMPIVGSEWKERTIYVELDELDEAFRMSLPIKPKKSPEPTPDAARPDNNPSATP